MLLNPSLWKWCTVRPNKPKHWSLEQRKVYCKGQARRTAGSCSKDPNSSMVFREQFLKATFEVTAARCMTFFWLVTGVVRGWCSRNLIHQSSGSNQSGISACSCHPPPEWRALVPTEQLEDMYQIAMSTPWGGTRTLPYHCTIVSWLLFLCFCIPSLPSLVTAWICPLTLREGTGGLSLFPTNKKLGTWKGFCTQKGPSGPCSASVPSFLWYSSSSRGTGGTRKGIQF